MTPLTLELLKGTNLTGITVPSYSADLRYDLAHFQNSSSNFYVPLGLNLGKLFPEYLCATKIKSDDLLV